MIDADEVVTEEAEAFTEQWLKLWHRATEILQGVGWTWPRDAGSDFNLDLMRPPEGKALTRWAADLAEVDASKARAFVADRPNEFIRDASAVLTSLAAIMDAVASATTDRPHVRAGALWGLNAATYMLRRHGQLETLESLNEAQHGLALLTANVGTLAASVAEHQTEARRIENEAERHRRNVMRLLVTADAYRLAKQKAESDRDRLAAEVGPSRRNLAKVNATRSDTADERYRGHLREWLHGLWADDPETSLVSAPMLWRWYNGANPSAAQEGREVHTYWPDDLAAAAAVRKIKREWGPPEAASPSSADAPEG